MPKRKNIMSLKCFLKFLLNAFLYNTMLGSILCPPLKISQVLIVEAVVSKLSKSWVGCSFLLAFYFTVLSSDSIVLQTSSSPKTT